MMFEKFATIYFVSLALGYGFLFTLRTYKQLNCYCNTSLRYYLDFKTYKVYKTCKSCGRRILVGSFDIEKSTIDNTYFDCKTGNKYDADCAYKCLEGKIEEWNKQYHLLEYCYYSLKTSVNN